MNKVREQRGQRKYPFEYTAPTSLLASPHTPLRWGLCFLEAGASVLREGVFLRGVGVRSDRKTGVNVQGSWFRGNLYDAWKSVPVLGMVWRSG